MSSFYRFVNCSERRQLWSIVLFESVLITLTWYYIAKIQLNNDKCLKTLKRDYEFISLYIDVPDDCTWWNLFWFRINRYTIYFAYIILLKIILDYYISTYLMMIHLYIWTGLLYHIFQAKQDDHFFSYNAPVLLHTLLIVLNLENQPFQDSQMKHRWIEIKMENEERTLIQLQRESQLWNEMIDQIRQCNDIKEMKQIIEHTDKEKEENRQQRYSYLNYPLLSPRSRIEQKTNQLLNLLISFLTFLLFLLSLWNYLFLFRRAFIITFYRTNIHL